MNEAFQRDANHVPITNLGLQTSKTITYVAGTTGAIGATTLFTVTGTVAINVFGVCSSDLAGIGTIEVGVSGSTACLANQQIATAIDNNMVWHDAVLAIGGQATGHEHIVTQNVIQTIATNTVTAGTITFYCLWTPLSEGASVVAS